MEPQQIKSAVESLLFVSSKPLTAKDVSKLLELELPVVQSAMDELAEERQLSGIVILNNSGEYQMATNSQNTGIVKKFLNAELREKLTDATVEVLAIITYRQPISKAEIEAIRGVNSQFSLRHLLMRGMIEKVPNPHDARGYLYQTTTEFLQHLGILSTTDLPDFETLAAQVKLPETVTDIAAADPDEDQQPPADDIEPAITEQADKGGSEIKLKQNQPAEIQHTEPAEEALTMEPETKDEEEKYQDSGDTDNDGEGDVVDEEEDDEADGDENKESSDGKENSAGERI